MRPKTIILLFVAVACGLVASIGVSQYMEKARGSAPQVATIKIFVATTEIAINEKLDAKNVRLEEWPRDRVPEGAVTDLKEVDGKFTKARLYKGEPILTAKVADSTYGKDKTIKPGFRVVAIKVNVDQVAGGLIRPGDRVDVIAFLKKGAEVPETKTMTILRDVSVFATDTETERETEKQGGSRDLRTVSLLVTAKQAETIILVKDLGTLSLTLRNPGDPTEEVDEGQSIRQLLGSDGENANEKKKDRKDQSDAGLAQFLTNTATDVVAAPPAPQPVAVAVTPPKFQIRIRTSNGDRLYNFKELDSAPEEVIPNTMPQPVPVTPVGLPTTPSAPSPGQDINPAPDMDNAPAPAETNKGSDANVNDLNQDAPGDRT